MPARARPEADIGIPYSGAMPHQTSLIAMLCAGFVLAFFLGMLAHRLRLSPIVGYLIAGMLVGPHTPGFVGDQALAAQLAEVGVILLMFGVGLHFSLSDLMDVRKVAVPGALAQMACATTLGWLLGSTFGWSNTQSVLFGLSLSVASTVVLLRTLESARLLDTGRGRLAVGWLVVEDIAMVLALVLVPALAARGGEGQLWTAVLTTLFKVGAFTALMLLVGRRILPRLLESVAGTGSRELFTLFVLACAIGVAFLAAELFGVSFALGAFFAGMLLSESPFGQKAAENSLPLRDAFAVLFFVSVGMLFDPMILIDHPIKVAATLAIILVGKSVGAWSLVRLLGRPDDVARTIAGCLAQIGEFSFILIGLGLSLKLLSQEAHDLVLAAAILSIVLNPLVFALIARRRPVAAGGDVATAQRPTQGHVLLIGYGRIGQRLADELARAEIPFLVIDNDGDRVINARAAGHAAIRGNAADADVLGEARPREASLAVLTIPDALEAGKVVERLKAGPHPIPVLARAHSDAGVRHLMQRGADAALLAEHSLANSLAEMIAAMPQFRTGPLPSSTATS